MTPPRKPPAPEKPLPTHGGRYVTDAEGNHVPLEPLPAPIEPKVEE